MLALKLPVAFLLDSRLYMYASYSSAVGLVIKNLSYSSGERSFNKLGMFEAVKKKSENFVFDSL